MNRRRGRKRKVITGSAEAVLVALAKIPDDERQRLKVCTLASLSACSEKSVRRAIKLLNQHKMLMMDRPCNHGPDAVYSFALTTNGLFYSNILRGTDI